MHIRPSTQPGAQNRCSRRLRLVVPSPVPEKGEPVKNVYERAAWTFVQTALAVVGAAGLDWVNVGTLKAALVAGGAATLSVVKTFAKDRLATSNA